MVEWIHTEINNIRIIDMNNISVTFPPFLAGETTFANPDLMSTKSSLKVVYIKTKYISAHNQFHFFN